MMLWLSDVRRPDNSISQCGRYFAWFTSVKSSRGPSAELLVQPVGGSHHCSCRTSSPCLPGAPGCFPSLALSSFLKNSGCSMWRSSNVYICKHSKLHGSPWKGEEVSKAGETTGNRLRMPPADSGQTFSVPSLESSCGFSHC